MDTGAVLYLRPALTSQAVVSRSTGAVLYITLRETSGRYTTTLTPSSAGSRNLRSWLPSQQAAWFDSEGRPTAPYYQFMNYLVNKVLGGVDGVSMNDIADFATVQQAQAITNAAVVAGLQQQALANAQALDAAVQVIKAASLSGSVQIPPTQLDSGGGGGDGGGGGGGGGE